MTNRRKLIFLELMSISFPVFAVETEKEDIISNIWNSVLTMKENTDE